MFHSLTSSISGLIQGNRTTAEKRRIPLECVFIHAHACTGEFVCMSCDEAVRAQVFPAELLSPAASHFLPSPGGRQGPKSPLRPQRGSWLWMLLTIQPAHTWYHPLTGLQLISAIMRGHVCTQLIVIRHTTVCASVFMQTSGVIYMSLWVGTSVGQCV